MNPKTHETIKKHKESGKKVAPELRVRATETRGVGVLISNERVDEIKSVEPKGSRLMVVTLKAKPTIKVICAYAPQAMNTIEDKIEFYEELGKELSKCNKCQLCILAGDFNARLGQPSGDGEEVIIGKHGYSDRSLDQETEEVITNRDMLIQLSQGYGMNVVNTRFQKPPNKKVTYRKPRTPMHQDVTFGGYEQIDFILVNDQFKNAVKDAEADMDSGIDTDHFPVWAKIACTFKKQTRKLGTEPTRYNESSLNEVNAKDMNIAMREMIKEWPNNTYENWATAYQKYVLQQMKPIKRKRLHYIKRHTFDMIRALNCNRNHLTKEEQLEKRKEIKRLTRADKREWSLNRVRKVMTLKEKWRGIRMLKEDYKPKRYARRDRHGKYTNLDERGEATADYLAEEHWKKKPSSHRDVFDAIETVLDHLKTCANIEGAPNIKVGPIEIRELEQIIKNMTRGKAPGPDNITADWLKDLETDVREKLLEMLNTWWMSHKLPEDMDKARVASLYKKGDPDKQENYRPISLLNIFYKIVAAVLKRRLEDGLDLNICENQFGFRKQRGTIHAMTVARRIQEYAERAGLPGTMIFLDWEKAFDKVDQQMMFKVMESYKIPEETLLLIKALYSNPMFQVESKEQSQNGKNKNWGSDKAVPSPLTSSFSR